jgi:hypothetical protein
LSESKFSINWRSVPEILWRALVFIIAIGILIFVSTRWNYWEGSPGWKETDDAYLQADLTPIASKVAGYISELPVQDYERVHGLLRLKTKKLMLSGFGRAQISAPNFSMASISCSQRCRAIF